MGYEVLPLPFKPHRLVGVSEQLMVSHYEVHYGGAVRRLNAVDDRLVEEGWTANAVLDFGGLVRERLIAANSVLLHEAYFDVLGGTGKPTAEMAQTLECDFGSVSRWREELTAMGRALAGGPGWLLLTWSDRLGRLTNSMSFGHEATLADRPPVLALDVDEHAYAGDFGTDTDAYIDAVLQNLDWERIEARYRCARDPAGPRLPWPNPDVPKVTVAELRGLLDRGEDITLVDVCLADDRSRRHDMLPGALFLPPKAIDDWADRLPQDRPVVAYCVYGFQVSGNATAELRRRGFDARALVGGITAWHAMGGATVPITAQHAQGAMS